MVSKNPVALSSHVVWESVIELPLFSTRGCVLNGLDLRVTLSIYFINICTRLVEVPSTHREIGREIEMNGGSVHMRALRNSGFRVKIARMDKSKAF